MLGVFVGREARASGCELEQDAARLPEVDRPEPEAVDHRRRLGAGLEDALPDVEFVLLVVGAPGDVVHRPGARDARLGRRGVVDVATAAMLASDLPRALALRRELQRLLEEGAALLGIGGVRADLLEALDRELARDLGMLGRQRLVRRLDDAQLEAEALGILEEERAVGLGQTEPIGPEVERLLRAHAQDDAVDHAATGATGPRARILEEGEVHAGTAVLVPVEQVVDGGVVLVDGLLDHAQPEHTRVVVDVRLRVRGDRADVMNAF